MKGSFHRNTIIACPFSYFRKFKILNRFIFVILIIYSHCTIKRIFIWNERSAVIDRGFAKLIRENYCLSILLISTIVDASETLNWIKIIKLFRRETFEQSRNSIRTHQNNPLFWLNWRNSVLRRRSFIFVRMSDVVPETLYCLSVWSFTKGKRTSGTLASSKKLLELSYATEPSALSYGSVSCNRYCAPYL